MMNCPFKGLGRDRSKLPVEEPAIVKKPDLATLNSRPIYTRALEQSPLLKRTNVFRKQDASKEELNLKENGQVEKNGEPTRRSSADSDRQCLSDTYSVTESERKESSETQKSCPESERTMFAEGDVKSSPCRKPSRKISALSLSSTGSEDAVEEKITLSGLIEGCGTLIIPAVSNFIIVFDRVKVDPVSAQPVVLFNFPTKFNHINNSRCWCMCVVVS